MVMFAKRVEIENTVFLFWPLQRLGKDYSRRYIESTEFSFCLHAYCFTC